MKPEPHPLWLVFSKTQVVVGMSSWALAWEVQSVHPVRTVSGKAPPLDGRHISRVDGIYGIVTLTRDKPLEQAQDAEDAVLAAFAKTAGGDGGGGAAGGDVGSFIATFAAAVEQIRWSLNETNRCLDGAVTSPSSLLLSA